jgi:glycosyltransferase involved in cell wall biosynthesis
MKHVVVLNQFALPRSEGGGTRHVDLFGRALGWQALIMAGNRNHYSQNTFSTADERFRLITVPRQTGRGVSRLLGWIVFSLQAFAIAVTRRQVDLVYGSSPHLLTPLAGLLAARLRRVPFILEVRDLWPESIVAAGGIRRGGVPHRIFARLERYLATHSAIIICVTGGWEKHFAGFGVPADHVVVIANGAELTDFQVSESRSELRAANRITGFTAIFAGAHGPMNGIDFILDAAAKLQDLNLLLIGDGPAKPAAIARARREGLTNVEFRDPVSKQDLARLLRAADVGIHSIVPHSVFAIGMSPNKIFDYMAAGLPIVSNAGVGLGRILTDGECGRIGGPNDLSKCLESVRSASSEQLRAWGSRSTAIVSERFSRTAAARQLTAALNSVSGTTEGV